MTNEEIEQLNQVNLLIYQNKDFFSSDIFPTEIIEDSKRKEIKKDIKELLNVDFFTKSEIYPLVSYFKGWNYSTKTFSTENLFAIRKNNESSSLVNITLIKEEVNLIKSLQEIGFILDTLDGIYNKIVLLQSQLSTMERSKEEEEPYLELEKKLDLLGKYYHWMLSEEKSLSTKEKENIVQKTMLTTVLLFRLKIRSDRLQCLGVCNKTFSKEEYASKEDCDCKGEIVSAPPYFEITDISFVYPERYSDIIQEERESSPKGIIEKVNRATFPYPLLLLLNQINHSYFSKNLIFPKYSLWEYTSTRDITKINFDFLSITDTEAFLVAYVSDSRFYHENLESSVIIPVLSRKITSNLKEGYSWHSTIENTQINHWKITPFIPLSDIRKYMKLEDIQLIKVEEKTEEVLDKITQEEEIPLSQSQLEEKEDNKEKIVEFQEESITKPLEKKVVYGSRINVIKREEEKEEIEIPQFERPIGEQETTKLEEQEEQKEEEENNE
ncbi:MAG: hypothetical protein ACTSRR_11085 [Candidatus Heimdallarchaeaceae archaeon]